MRTQPLTSPSFLIPARRSSLLRVWPTLLRVWPTLLLSSAVLLGAAPLHADTAGDMHDALKERWYTTEIVVFRALTPPGSESLLIEGKKLSAAEQAALGTEAQDTFSEREPTQASEDTPGNAAIQGKTAINVLTLDDSERPDGDDQADRPELDAEPWDTIRDYDGSNDLGELVARNMATWETQLRAVDGQPLPEEALTLSEAATKLGKSRNLEVLLHTGWTQAVPPRDQGQPIALTGAGLSVETQEPFTTDSEPTPDWGLSGNVTVTLGRYLHFQPTLFYTPEYVPSQTPLDADQDPAPAGYRQPSFSTDRQTDTASGRLPTVRDLSETTPRVSALDRLRDATANEQEAASFAGRADRRSDTEWDYPPYVRLDQTRRLRSGELHYIDHPELRVLVRITPVVAEELLQEQFALLQ